MINCPGFPIFPRDLDASKLGQLHIFSSRQPWITKNYKRYLPRSSNTMARQLNPQRAQSRSLIVLPRSMSLYTSRIVANAEAKVCGKKFIALTHLDLHLHFSRRVLKERHINMIAFSGTIGNGLFLGSGRALASAGPGGAVLSYILVGTIISSVISCLGEMTALMPVNAPVMEFPRRYLDRGVGFAVGWIYWQADFYTIDFPLLELKSREQDSTCWLSRQLPGFLDPLKHLAFDFANSLGQVCLRYPCCRRNRCCIQCRCLQI